MLALAAALLVASPAAASADVLVGSSAIQSSADSDDAGLAEAFQATASTTGSVGALNVYVDAGTASTKLTAGLYSDSSGHPGTLLAQGSMATPTAGAWNTVTIPSTPVTAGTTYWIAILGTGGILRFRDHCCSGGTPAENSSQKTLTSLPASWSSGPRYSDGPASAYGSTSAPTPPPPDVGGQWGPLMNWPLVAIHTTVMRNGKLLVMDGWQRPNDAEVYDPDTQSFSQFNNGLALDLFCSAHVTLADGRVAVVGGHGSSHLGLDTTMVFDPATNSWTAGAKMSYPRWYPTVTELGDGRLVAISGNIDSGTWADIPEIYDPSADRWTQIFGVNTSGVHEEEYPLSFLLPSGKIFTMATSVGRSYLLDPDTPSWSAVGGSPTSLNGSAVMYRPGKILYSGGGTPLNSRSPSQATAQTIDLNASTPAWQATGAMNAPRYSHQLVPLPDGKVLAVGGDQDMNQTDPDRGELTAEEWDPDSGQWTSLASMSVARIYHSTAVLMPDGRVLSAGGGHSNDSTGPGQKNAQYYSPPYLFKGSRPTISSAPSSAGYGSTITVGTPDAASIGSVSLVSMSSETHTLDMNQHFVPLTFTRGSGTLSVQLPSSSSLAPPGYYMLFIVNSQGVPSLASTVKMVPTAADIEPPSAPPDLAANGSPGQVSLSWSASSDNVGVTGYDVHRSTSPNFTPSAANRIAQPTGTSYVDSPLAPGTYYYRVLARDKAGNLSGSSPEASATVPGDTTAPTVSLTAPGDGATVSGVVSVTANASDDVGVAGVQFKLDGADLNAEDTSSPYSTSWNTATASAGSHTLTAVARDAAGNTTTSSPVKVTVQTSQVPGLVAAYNFDEGAGPTVVDRSGNLNDGNIFQATRSIAGKTGGALSFDGVNDWVTVPDANSLDLTTGMTLEAWVYPTAGANAWRTALLKERTNGLSYALYESTNTGRPAAYVNIAGSDRGVAGPSAPPLNTWTHIAATYNGSRLTLYVNGSQVSSAAVSGSVGTSTGPLRIGGNAIWPEWFAGMIDDVRVYNQALAAAQIQSDMNTPVR